MKFSFLAPLKFRERLEWSNKKVCREKEIEQSAANFSFVDSSEYLVSKRKFLVENYSQIFDLMDTKITADV